MFLIPILSFTDIKHYGHKILYIYIYIYVCVCVCVLYLKDECQVIPRYLQIFTHNTFGLALFKGISTFIGYLMAKPLLEKNCRDTN